MEYWNKLSWEKKRVIRIVFLGLALIVIAFILQRIWASKYAPYNGPIGGAEVQLGGKFICLPLKTAETDNTECKLGFVSDNDIYYAIDTSSASSLSPNVSPADRIYIYGVVIPATEIESDDFDKYDINGLIRVRLIYPPTEEDPEPPFTGPLENG